MAVGTGDVVISAEQVRAELEAERPVVILAVRREGEADERRLPGAVPVSLTRDLVGEKTKHSGNHPLPTDEQVQDAVQRWGIDTDSLVVVYSTENPALASRVWWTLRWAGVPDVRYLDGGLEAWEAAGGELSSAAPVERSGTFTVTTGSLPVLDTEQAGELARSGVLFDARGADAYAGEPQGGHIPGAISVAASRNLDPDGRLASSETLRELYAQVNADTPVGAYCGGGTAATLDVLALARLGITAALYPGSFSAWTSDPARPVVTGVQPE
ncbi:sulfurtransferase [Nocardia sp. NPDC057227]|uniref:sulfurtransferase n=1 Tax=Nocardia sp. NPDC057227 TaxID=3346056 RepID=UPI003632E052